MSFIYMILLFWTFYFIILYKVKEPFNTTQYVNEINTIKNQINLLHVQYADVHSQIMNNYHFECPPDEPTTTTTKIPQSQSILDDDELQNIQNNLDNIARINETEQPKIEKPLISKTNRLDYDTIVRKFIENDIDDGLDDIQYIPQKIKEQKKLENYLKCYNKIK